MLRDNKFFKITSLLFTALLCCLAGCTPDTTVTFAGTGRMLPSVTLNTDVTSDVYDVRQSLSPVPEASQLSLSLIDLVSDNEHTWTPWTTYDAGAGINASTYRVEAFYGDSLAEGFDVPFFYASKVVSVSAGDVTPVNLEARLANAMLVIHFDESLRNTMHSVSATLHSSTGSLVDYESNESRAVFVHPGRLALILNLTLPDGRELSFVGATITKTLGGHYYEINVGLRKEQDVDAVVVSLDPSMESDDVVTLLTEEFISSPSPQLSPSGFANDGTVTVIEGNEPVQPVIVSSPDAALSRLLLNLSTTALNAMGLDGETDLCNLTPAQTGNLENAGFVVTRADGKLTVDFTRMIANLRLRYGSTGELSASLVAVSNCEKVSEPLRLKVSVEPSQMGILSVGTAVVGIDETTLRVKSDVAPGSNLVVQYLDERSAWVDLRILSVDKVSANVYDLKLALPEGQAMLSCRLLYCGQRREEFVIERVSPEFSISADAYAVKAYVTIHAATEAMRTLIVRNVSVFNSTEPLTVVERDEENGVVLVAGLKSDSRYTLRASIFKSPTSENQFSQPVEVTTEKALQLPNAGFEDAKRTIRYDNMPSGGRFSQSVVPIYNRQNYASYDLMTPKNWANTNAKTFCTGGAIPNTWYMQPSVYIDTESYSGGYSVKLQSTAWDNAGKAIADYLQTGQPYLNYSPVVPEIRYRAAGKLFLGNYSFNVSNATENYDEGMSFSSRPNAINGFYKYLPCQQQTSDHGLVEVHLYGRLNGRRVEIAGGRGLLEPSLSFRAFSVPLTYTHPDIKAENITVMFASSEHVGSIAQETAAIITHVDASSATSLGSALWIDEISLSY